MRVGLGFFVAGIFLVSPIWAFDFFDAQRYVESKKERQKFELLVQGIECFQFDENCPEDRQEFRHMYQSLRDSLDSISRSRIATKEEKAEARGIRERVDLWFIHKNL